MTNGTYLSKESILSASDLAFEDVQVPEWGGTVRVREMSAAEREHLSVLYKARNEDIEAGKAPLSANAIAIALSVVDAKGARLFSDDEIAKLGEKSPVILERLGLVVMRVNHLGGEAQADLVKNSEASTSADSPSA